MPQRLWVFSSPHSGKFKADILAALNPAVLGVVLSFFLMSLFETSGTLIAIAQRGGFLDAQAYHAKLMTNSSL